MRWRSSVVMAVLVLMGGVAGVLLIHSNHGRLFWRAGVLDRRVAIGTGITASCDVSPVPGTARGDHDPRDAQEGKPAGQDVPSPSSQSPVSGMAGDTGKEAAGPRGTGEPVQPVIMTDNRSWTVIGADTAACGTAQTRLSGGVGVAHSNGLWLAAAEGVVTRTNDRISEVAFPGRSDGHFDGRGIMGSNVVMRETGDGGVSLIGDMISISNAPTRLPGQAQ